MEIGKLWSVKPKGAIEMCTKLIRKSMIINSQMDAMTFMIYGGQGITKKYNIDSLNERLKTNRED